MPVDLRGLLRESATVWGARCAAEGVLFQLEEPPDALVVTTDPTRVRQIGIAVWPRTRYG